MKRREFITLLGGAAAWPLAARAQQEAMVRRIGMLSEISEAQMQPMISAFRQQLRQLGWKDESIAIDSRFAIIDAAQFQAISAALIDTTPDLVVAYRLCSRSWPIPWHRDLYRVLPSQAETSPV